MPTDGWILTTHGCFREYMYPGGQTGGDIGLPQGWRCGIYVEAHPGGVPNLVAALGGVEFSIPSVVGSVLGSNLS